jgi:hypothetical protein
MAAQTSGIPSYLKKYQKQILQSASDLFKQGKGRMPQYQIAGMSPYQQQAMKMAAQGVGSYMPMLQAGADTLGSAAGAYKSGLGTLADAGGYFDRGARQARQGSQYFKKGARQAGAGQDYLMKGKRLTGEGAQALRKSQDRFRGQGYKRFMDPYLEEVVQAGQRDIQEQGAQAGNLQRGRGLGAAALGGSSRANLETRRVGQETARDASEFGAQLRSQGFQQAMDRAGSAFESQKGRQQTAGQAFGNLATGMGQFAGQQANIGRTTMGAGTGMANIGRTTMGAGTGMANIGTGIGSLAGGLGNVGTAQAKLGGLGQQMGQSDINMLYGMGQNQQDQRQRELEALRQNQYQEYMRPYQELGFYSDIFAGTPSSSMSFTMPSMPNPYTQIGGAFGAAGAGYNYFN